MELAAIGYVVESRRLEGVRALLAKGVMDHADGSKNDCVKEIAARNSAEFVVEFLRAHCPPRRPASLTEARVHVSHAVSQLQAFMQEISRLPQIQGLSPVSRQDILAAINRLAESDDPRAVQSMEQLKAGRAEEAFQSVAALAADEERLAKGLAEGAEAGRERAAEYWADAGDVAVLVDMGQAVAAYEKSIELRPFERSVWVRYGRALWWLGRFRDALRTYTHLLGSFPEGHLILLLAVDPVTALANRQAYLERYPEASREIYDGMARIIVVLGLSIAELFRAEPSLVSSWIVRTGEPDGAKRPFTVEEADELIQTIVVRAYELGPLSVRTLRGVVIWKCWTKQRGSI